MIRAVIEYAESVLKHGISEEEIRHAMLYPVYDEIQDSDVMCHLGKIAL